MHPITTALREAAGDWVAQLKVILRQGPATERKVGSRPVSTPQKSARAAQRLLKKLIKGLGQDWDKFTEMPDADKVIFNAVEQLIDGITATSKTGETKLQSLYQFYADLQNELTDTTLDARWQKKIEEAVVALQKENVEQQSLLWKRYQEREIEPEAMLSTVEGVEALKDSPERAGTVLSRIAPEALEYLDYAKFGDAKDDVIAEGLMVIANRKLGPELFRKLALQQSNVVEGAGKALSAIDPEALENLDLDAALGPAKNDALAEALAAIADMQPREESDVLDRETHFDPALFRILALRLDAKEWSARPKTRQQLWENARYDQIHELIDRGVGMLAGTTAEAIGKTLSAVDPAGLEQIDLQQAFGNARNDVLAEAMLAIADKKPPMGGDPHREIYLDPALFRKLATSHDSAHWNTEGGRNGGLGARVCRGLWQNGSYDQICELIEHGVDTSLSARVPASDKAAGVYSGFVLPIQHVVSALLRDVASRDPGNAMLKGAHKILTTLKSKDAKMLTSWEEVKGSELIVEFTEHPGTIWGFENMRLPYVQAAHTTGHGKQPVRMLEIWDAVGKSLTPRNYSRLIAHPEKAIQTLVEEGVKELREKVKKNHDIYADIPEGEAGLQEFIDNFKRDATSCLEEFAVQMPKGTFIRSAKDASLQSLKDVRVADIAGILWKKFMSGLGCKAGLWWAKKEGKPVYYCLDGVHMKDVINYKAVKNKTIQEFINGGGHPAGAQGHDEVISIVEIREILKHWKDLQGTVKFVLKGEILKDTAKVERWAGKMQAANEAAGRTPAPPKKDFKNELEFIAQGLSQKIDDTLEGAIEARDIVRKFGYLIKVANTRPQIVLEYIIGKCEVLTKHDLIAPGLIDVAIQFRNAEDKDIPEIRVRLLGQINLCHDHFRTPLTKALTRHPRFGQGEKS